MDGISAAQVRIARPTDNLTAVTDFYHLALGMPIIGSFNEHDGYDGIMLGIKGANIHLEFTQHADGSPCPAPSLDNLLVLYYATQAEFDSAVTLIESYGHKPVAPENEYWLDKGLTYEDPDGWRVVLFNGLYSN
ncbi:MAG: VOC family protein [Sphingobacteriales bacterium JAD_PAG50586_3]|nr:MAG: VOC family protein [Sphingobacteriales bacterium JAD_PAG50586_3]